MNARLMAVENTPVEGASETLKERIRERLATLRLTGREASRMAGLGLSYVNDILSGQSKNPAAARLEKLAQVLQCEPAYLTGGQTGERAEVVAFPSATSERGAGVRLFMPEWPEVDGAFRISDSGTIPAPFDPATGGYAVSVPDETMAPRFKTGELVFANPRRPISIGASVVIRFVDDRAIIREVVDVQPTSIKVRSHADAEVVGYAKDQVRSVHRITASAEA